MPAAVAVVEKKPIVYPETDGRPMAENTLQFQWIVTIQGGLDAQWRDDPQVFVAGDLFWYPVQGHPKIRLAPDIMVAFGRPKGHRSSYLQWEEGGIAPQVVWEVLSPSNTRAEMRRKLAFYQRHGVEEYYVYDPDAETLEGWQRRRAALVAIPVMDGWVSPRLGIRFTLPASGLQLYHPDGTRFETFLELTMQRDQARQETAQAQRETTQARQELAQTRQEIAQTRQEAAQAAQRAERLAARLRALGLDEELDETGGL